MTAYRRARGMALADPSTFWLEAAGRVDWIEAPEVGLDDSGAPLYRWFPDGVLISYRILREGPARRASR